jgi:hypothetical protein
MGAVRLNCNGRRRFVDPRNPLVDHVWLDSGAEVKH